MGRRDGRGARRAARQERDHCQRPGPPLHGMIVLAGARGGGRIESGTTRPWPMAYAGGIRIGSFPRIGAQPTSARAAARSAARTPLHAIMYDFTVGVWFKRYGLPRETSTVGFSESVTVMSRASESGSAMLPFQAMGRTFAANTAIGARAMVARAESYDAVPDIGQSRKKLTVSPLSRSCSSMRWPTVEFSSSP